MRDLAHASSLCGACKDVCPVRIDIPRMLVELREHLDRREDRAVDGAGRVQGLPAPAPVADRVPALRNRRPVSRSGRSSGRARLRGLPLVFGKWTQTRDLPPVAARTFREAVEGAPVTARAEFLERIRREVSKTPGLFGASTAPRPADPAAAAETVRRELAERWPEALERFRVEFERVAGVFHRVPDLGRGARRDRHHCPRMRREEPGHLGSRRARLRRRARPDPRGPRGRRGARGEEDEASRLRHREQAARAQVGVTGADLVLAETGTLILLSGSGRPRSTSLLPDVHVAVFGRDRLLESLEQVGIVLEALHADADHATSGAMINFITGPSRTADIELTLTRGVHGPKEVHAIFVEAP